MTTQNCAECGTRAEPGQSFCDACGAVLGWDQAGSRAGQAQTSGSPSSASSGPAASTPAEGTGTGRDAFGSPGDAGAARTQRPLPDGGPAPTPSTATGSHPTGSTSTSTSTSVSMPGDAASGATADASRLPNPSETGGWATTAPPAASGGSTASGGRTPGENNPTVPLPTSQQSAADRARSLLVPLSEPEPAHDSPPPAAAPVLPGRPDTDRPQVRVPGPQQDTGNGPPCSWCSTPNRPDRHFCVRCAMPLADNDERPAAPRPWWRRLTGSRRREIPWAGDRPRIRRAFDRIGTWITAAVVATLAILGVVYIPDGVHATQDHFAKRAPVAPSKKTASRSYTGHKPQLAFDKLNNTWWGPGVTSEGKGEWIEAEFDRPTRLLNVVITPGVSIRPDDLDEANLPQRIKATVTTKDGKKTERELTLDQGSGEQKRNFRFRDAVKVRFTVESSYIVADKKQVAIAEIEFFGPANSDS
ncbi:NADase-type glycan-binding domain-containing protein [Streptomyces sp. NBC_01012]|uniref:NADase-type glycan-binding domain-containing protein n=1 Tax=Streptomyces sp. NBC_01012 TaxID=2903717 RepID=UPI00386691DC|nr:zinc ribbon domain-containing protein [Streptomyces sp. NBC_01012]